MKLHTNHTNHLQTMIALSREIVFDLYHETACLPCGQRHLAARSNKTFTWVFCVVFWRGASVDEICWRHLRSLLQESEKLVGGFGETSENHALDSRRGCNKVLTKVFRYSAHLLQRPIIANVSVDSRFVGRVG